MHDEAKGAVEPRGQAGADAGPSRVVVDLQDSTIGRVPVVVALHHQAHRLITHQGPIAMYADLLPWAHGLGGDGDPGVHFQPGEGLDPVDQGLAQGRVDPVGQVAVTHLVEGAAMLAPG